jgi:hypothetical protein
VRDVQLRRDFERLCRKRGLPISTAYLSWRYIGQTEQFFEFFKEGIAYNEFQTGSAESEDYDG